jgi:hypothetical protein
VFSLVVTGIPGQPPVCGNAIAQPGEACAGSDLAGQTCQSLDFFSGVPGCSPACSFDTTHCLAACKASGASCSAGSQCCSGTCSGRPGLQTCR